MNSNVEAWIQILAWVVTGGALVLLIWAIFWDRLRHLLSHKSKPRRCPKCWYDMSGSPGLVCSECGHAAKHEGALFIKWRRRWLWIVISLILFSASVGFTARWEDVRKRGWVAAVPTTLAIAALPLNTCENIYEPRAPMYRRVGKIQHPDLSLSERLMYDVGVERIEAGTMWIWQERWLLRRCMKGDRRRPLRSDAWFETYGVIIKAINGMSSGAMTDLLPKALLIHRFDLKYRKRWPRGEPVYFNASIRELDDTLEWRVVIKDPENPARHAIVEPREIRDSLDSIFSFAGAPGSFSLSGLIPREYPLGDIFIVPFMNQNKIDEFEISLQHRRNGGIHPWIEAEESSRYVRIELVDSVDEILKPIEIPELTSTIEALQTIELLSYTDHAVITLPLDGIPVEIISSNVTSSILEKTAISFRGELLAGNETMSSDAISTSFIIRNSVLMESHWNPTYRVDLNTSDFDRLRYTVIPLSLRLIGDPVIALRDIDAEYYWKGEATWSLIARPATSRRWIATPAQPTRIPADSMVGGA